MIYETLPDSLEAAVSNAVDAALNTFNLVYPVDPREATMAALVAYMNYLEDALIDPASERCRALLMG